MHARERQDDAHRSRDPAGVIEDRRADAGGFMHVLPVGDGDAVLADLVQVLLQGPAGRARKRVRAVQPFVHIVLDVGRILIREQNLSDSAAVQIHLVAEFLDHL